MNRKQKIEFLKALQRGEVNLKSMQHGKPYFVRHLAKHNVYEVSTFIQGSKRTTMTPTEFEEFKRKLDEHNRIMSDQILKNYFFFYEDPNGDPQK